MNLHGYDVGLELSRGLINRVLRSISKTDAWPAPWKYEWTSPPSSDQVTVLALCTFTLSDPRVMPSWEVSEPIGRKVEAVVAFTIDYEMDVFYKGERIQHIDETIVGDAGVDISLSIVRGDATLGISLQFANVVLKRLNFSGSKSSTISELVKNVAESLIEESINRRTFTLPLIENIARRMGILGTLRSESLKVHWYQTESGDLAAGMGMIFDQGAPPVPDDELAKLRRASGGGEFVVSMTTSYLNQCLSRAVGRLPFNAQFGDDGRPRRTGPIIIRSVTLRVVSGMLDITIEMQASRVPISLTLLLHLTVQAGRFEVVIVKKQVGQPGPLGAATRGALNAVLVIILAAVGRITGKDLQESLADKVELALNSNIIELVGQFPMPQGARPVRLMPNLFHATTEAVTISFRAEDE